MMSAEAGATQRDGRVRALAILFSSALGGSTCLIGLALAENRSALVFAPAPMLALGLLSGGAYLLVSSSKLPRVQPRREEQIRSSLMLRAVSIILSVAIVTAIAILSLLHLPQYIPAAAFIIFGLEMLPLAGAYRLREVYVGGLCLVVWSAGCLALVQPAHVASVVSLGSGIALMLSSAALLWTSFARLGAEGTPRVT